MKKYLWPILILLILGGLWIFFSKSDPAEKIADTPSAETSAPSLLPDEPTPPAGLREDLSAQFLNGYGDKSKSPQNDLTMLYEVLFTFNHTLKGRTELPRTTNKKLADALLGENNDLVRFISPKSPALNEKGEIIDRWGSPMFFHFEDAFTPDLRSAGPDQKLWSDDDVILSNTTRE